jgi:hypothetical protein
MQMKQTSFCDTQIYFPSIIDTHKQRQKLRASQVHKQTNFTPRPLYTQEKNTGTHWTGGWMSPRTDLDVVAKRKIMPCQESKPGPPARSQSLYRLSCLLRMWSGGLQKATTSYFHYSYRLTVHNHLQNFDFSCHE